jgi:murein DD-endopeptidase MepM/ murein hydrolase activator NlpD
MHRENDTVPTEPKPREVPQTGQRPALENISSQQGVSQSRLLGIWEGLSRAGMAETALRLGTHALSIALIMIVAWAMHQLYLHTQQNESIKEAALAASPPTPTPTEIPPRLPPYQPDISYTSGIYRMAMLNTTIPTRPRTEVITYTVKAGDTLFDIAEKFGLEPQTILWGNQFVLGDNPHNLRIGQELNILPVNGTYHRWSEGEGLNGVADFFGVTPEDIINYPGNHLNPETIGDYSNPNIEPGTWLIVPGGQREFVSWSAPAIPRDDPSVAKNFGTGACGSRVDGPLGVGVFIWPSNNHFLSGFDYSPATNHPGIDIDGETGDAIYAVDNGVVVYAGWNDWGYGNVVVINHGNGWQTLYAHLSAYNVGCGQGVFQGTVIGAMGSTGNSTGSHLHFEMMYNGAKVNPWDYLP